jgi:hypothetical protein
MVSMALSGRLGMLGSFSALPFFTESLQRLQQQIKYEQT